MKNQKSQSRYVSLPSLAIAILATCALPIAIAAPAFADGGATGVGGGGDKVEVLFLKAKQQMEAKLNRIQPHNILSLNLAESYRTWLQTGDHLSKIQFYAHKMELKMQNAPCLDDGAPRGTSFDNSDPERPTMCVSYSMNQNTTRAQAESLVVHEAGHFTGEMNHLFLSDLGQAIAQAEVTLSTGNLHVDSFLSNPDGSTTFIGLDFYRGKWFEGFLAAMEGEDRAQFQKWNDDTAQGGCRQLGYRKMIRYTISRCWVMEETPPYFREVPRQTVQLDSAGSYLNTQNRRLYIRTLTCSN